MPSSRAASKPVKLDEAQLWAQFSDGEASFFFNFQTRKRQTHFPTINRVSSSWPLRVVDQNMKNLSALVLGSIEADFAAKY